MGRLVRNIVAVLVLGYFVARVCNVFAAANFVGNSSTTAATQPSSMQHIVKTSDGTLHAFVQMGTQTSLCGGVSKSGLLWFDSTDGGTTWVCQGQLSSDTTNLMYASAVVDSSDNIYVVYSVTANGSSANYQVYYDRLTKGTGSTWTLGAQQTVLSSTSTTAYSYATVTVQGSTRLWLAVRYLNNPNYQVQTYYSDGLTDAPTWTQSSANLETPGSNGSWHIPTIVRF